MMKNTKVTLSTLSFIDSLVSTKIIDDLKPNSNEEIAVSFQVPPNLANLEIMIETEVKNISKGTTEKLKSTHSIKLDTKNNANSFYESYFRKYKGDYYYYLLGKNGEALVDSSIQLTFAHSTIANQSTSVLLNTDEDGKIKLGPLKDIRLVTSSFNGPNGPC